MTQPAADAPLVRPASRRTPNRPCLNCGDPTPGNYCRSCGQRKVEVRVSLRRMLMEALDDQFSLNSALPRTLGALLFLPGQLTREYMAGRIVRYIPPFRLYLVSSLLFFVALSVDLRVEGGTGGLQVSMDSTSTGGATARRGGWIGVGRANTGWAELDSLANQRARELGAMEPREAARRVGGRFLEYVPQTMFILLPLFAGLLKLLYLSQRRLYVEHFVFALHLHAFVFLVFTARLLAPSGPVSLAVVAWAGIYTFLALHRVYGQSWARTVMKFIALGASYTLVLSLALLGTLLAALALL